MMRPFRFIMILVLAGVTYPLAAAPPQQAELARHQGTWSVLSFRREGKDTPAEITQTIIRIVEGDHVVWKREGKSFAATKVELDPSKSPATIDVIPDGGPARDKRILGIYKLEGNRLTICMADADQPRPTEFKAEQGSKWTLMRFERKTADR